MRNTAPRTTQNATPNHSSAHHWEQGSTLRPWLLLPALIYRKIIKRRNRFFDRPSNCKRAELPVISIGNITTGGTGKTPLVIEIVQRLQSLGASPAILTRGYAAAKGQPADEVLEFAEALPHTPVVVDADRLRGAQIALREHQADCCVLDDGFQHRRLHRDLDIVLIDALDPFGGGQILPAGKLREPLDGLRRAHLLIITRTNQVLPDGLSFTRSELERLAPGKPILTASVAPQGLRPAASSSQAPSALLPLERLQNRRVVPVCGVGNPRSFRGILANYASELLGQFTFRDHHRYSPADVERIAQFAEKQQADCVICTRKDSVKLFPLWPDAAPPLWRLEISFQIKEGNEALDAELRRVCKRGGAESTESALGA